MDEINPIRELVVEAMELEQALIDGLQAQAPRTDRQGIQSALATFRARVDATLRKIEATDGKLGEVR